MHARPFTKSASSNGNSNEIPPNAAAEVLPAEWIFKEVAKLRVANEMLSERLDNLESGHSICGFSNLKGLLAHLHAEVQELKEKGIESNGNGNANDSHHEDTKQLEDSRPQTDITWAELEEMDLQHERYQLNPNTWEIPLMCGVGVLKPGVSFMIAFSLLLTLAIQMTLIGGLSTFGSDFDENTVADMKRWRATEGHSVNFAQPLTKTSLVSRVCAKDEALSVGTDQRDLYFALLKFSKTIAGMPCGPLLAIAVLCVWSLYIVVEWNDIRELMVAIRSLPRGKTHIRLDGPENCKFCSISVKRLCFVSVICAFRFAITIGLFVLGSLWQIRTRDMENLVLNASALAFIMADVPRLIYDVSVPVKAKVLLETMEPLKRVRRKRCRGFEVLMLFDMFCVAAFALMCAYYLFEDKGMQDDAMHFMCDGELDFIWGKDSFDRVLVAETYEFQDGFIDSHMFPFEIDYIIDVVNGKNDIGVFDAQQLSTAIHRDRRALSNERMDCTDRNLTGMWVTHSNRQMSCEEARGLCASNSYVRMECPVTCGCDDPFSGMPFVSANMGCPRKACLQSPSYKAFLRDTPCEDLTASSLSMNQPWLIMWDRLYDRVKNVTRTSRGSLSNQDIVPALVSMRNTGKTLGCAALRNNTVRNVFTSIMTLEFANLCDAWAAYCPISCGCQTNMRDGCPDSCGVDNSTRL